MKQIKRGFTLIEMLVVIAVIAILVSIAVPVVLGSTDRAGAATNAANLRSVEGELISMMLLNPDAFGDWKYDRQEVIDFEREGIGQLDDTAKDLQEGLAKAEAAVAEYAATFNEKQAAYNAIGKSAEQLAQEILTIEGKKALCTLSYGCKRSGGLFSSTITHSDACKAADAELATARANRDIALDYAAALAAKEGLDEAVTAAKNTYDQYMIEFEKAANDRQNQLNEQQKEMYTFRPENGYITLDDGTKIECPTSEKVDIGDVNITKGKDMVVFIDNVHYEAYAYYVNDESTEYDSADFARVADEKAAG